MDRLSGERARALAQELWQGYGVRYLGHAMRRMAERGVTQMDVESALESGAVTDTRWDGRHGEWRYRLAGTDVEGGDLAVVFTFEGETLLIIITLI